MGRNKFTFGIVSTRRYLKIARERLAIIWNANNERLLIVEHWTNLYCSAEMFTASKLTAPKNKMAPVTCVVGRSIYTTKIEEVVCPPNISETVAVRTMKLAYRPRIASTTIKTHFKTNFTAHFINYIKNNSANRRWYLKHRPDKHAG